MNSISQFPACIVYRDDDITNKAVNGPTLVLQDPGAAEHLQNLFFIERLLTKESRAPDSQILEISMELGRPDAHLLDAPGPPPRPAGRHRWLVMSSARGGCPLPGAAQSVGAARLVPDGDAIQRDPAAEPAGRVPRLSWPAGVEQRHLKRVVRHVLDHTPSPAADQAGAVEGMGLFGGYD
ncbi:Uncharacterized protein TPAR_04315 [Tolypocladium paradoxum]|uniref:Uncharacterized protein n=1 Tax=Tolypocladium paradoxum TaxID=94208 RepID=A0A2S4KZ77_9HYPO|nr:Uncharacterized protein TPAR_04315 [Tolypocladium paradoxum]